MADVCVVKITHIDPKVFEDMLKYIYTSECSTDNYEELLVAADKV